MSILNITPSTFFRNVTPSTFFRNGKEQVRWRDKKTGRFVKKPKEQVRWRDKKTGRFVKKPIYFRAAVVCNNVPIINRLHHFGYTVISTDAEDASEEKLLEYMEDEIGYNRDSWWFSVVFGVEHPKPVESEANEEYYQHRVGKGKKS
jgi:hypothetical protein